jgi:tetratricopeptide (TPR) repeat protein
LFFVTIFIQKKIYAREMAKENIQTRNKMKKVQELIAQDRHSEAMAMLEMICNSDQQNADAWSNLGKISIMREDFTKARECFDHVVNLQKNSVEAHINLANSLVRLGMLHDAVSIFRKVLNLQSDDLIAHQMLNATLVKLGELNEAVAGYDRMLELSPNNPRILVAKAKVLDRKGDKQQAYELLKPLIKQYPNDAKIAVAFATVCNEDGRRNDAIIVLETIIGNSQIKLQPETAREVHSVLGQLYDSVANYKNAFSHFQQMNILKARTIDIEKFTQDIDEAINTFSAEALKNTPNSTIPTNSAIFIIGMPRSGTSLVEQILASHTEVTAAGELNDILKYAKEIADLVDSHNPYPHYLSELTTDICNSIAQRYISRLNDISSSSRYVTNKMPHNFLVLGLISKLFPQARLIHCRRDSRDTCVSCFFQNFTHGHHYATSLETLGAYYRQYEKLMSHWEKVIDRPVITIQYEELVADQESQTRRLLDFLDLPWDDRCLNFYNNERVIHTASYDQVRQPIYYKSVGRWKNYENYIQPLLKALAEQNPSSD